MEITKDDHFMASGTEVVSMPRQVKISNSISGSSYDEAKANAEFVAKCFENSEIILTLLESTDKADEWCIKYVDERYKLAPSHYKKAKVDDYMPAFEWLMSKLKERS